MTKTKLKVSGAFRCEQSIHEFFALRSVIQTAKKEAKTFASISQRSFIRLSKSNKYS